MKILDYSAGYPGAYEIKRAGYSGVIRYLKKEGSSLVKPIVKTEYDDMLAHGLDVAFVYQHLRKSRVTEGFTAGVHDAVWAFQQAESVGANPRAIYFAVDFDASFTQYEAIANYMLGAAQVIGHNRVGVYGKYNLISYLFNRDLITWGWQTYAWSTGHNQHPSTYNPRAHLFQQLSQVVINGISCDVNDVLRADYGQTPNPNPPSVTDYIEEDGMKTFYVRGDATGLMDPPHETITWGDAVFLVEASADGLKRRHISPEEWIATAATGATVTQHSQSWVDSIPWGETPGLFWWENNEEEK